MTRSLKFNPQAVFSRAYNMDADVIIKERSFFNSDYDYFVDVGGRGGRQNR